MGRRSLPKLDPTIDFSRHLAVVRELPEQFAPSLFFSRPQLPLEVEVGSGKGLFLSSASRAYPDRNFLGVEIAEKYARFAASRLAKQQANNAVVLHGDAQVLLTRWLPTGSCSAVHVYFPDPWWKKRHHKRRIMNPQFVQQVERVLCNAGTLHFWTDVEDYFHRALETLGAHTRLSGPLAVPELPAQHDLDYRTHFERRMRLQELQVWRAEFRKLTSSENLSTDDMPSSPGYSTSDSDSPG